MIHIGTFDGTVYYNPVNKYSIIQMKTKDQSVPKEGRSSRRYDDHLGYPAGQSAEEILKQMFSRFSEELPEECNGRQMALSDVIELDCGTRRTYYYVNGPTDFRPVRFSPMLAKKR